MGIRIHVTRNGVTSGQPRDFDANVEFITIGRNPNNDVLINDPKVSGEHLVVVRSPHPGDHYFVRDLSSTYGTYLAAAGFGERRMIRQLWLMPEYLIEIGHGPEGHVPYQLRFETGDFARRRFREVPDVVPLAKGTLLPVPAELKHLRSDARMTALVDATAHRTVYESQLGVLLEWLAMKGKEVLEASASTICIERFRDKAYDYFGDDLVDVSEHAWDAAMAGKSKRSPDGFRLAVPISALRSTGQPLLGMWGIERSGRTGGEARAFTPEEETLLQTLVNYAVTNHPLFVHLRADSVENAAAFAWAARPAGLTQPDMGLPTLIVTADKNMRDMLKQVDLLATKSDAHILLFGDTGTGKELVAERIWRKGRPGESFVPVDCASIPSETFESVLFGHKKGAYTTAIETTPGLIRSAKDGTLFLDEIGELSDDHQAKFLRVLETRTVTRVGETGADKVDFRAIGATERGPESVRESLRQRFERTFHLIPLKERKADISILVHYFLDQIASEDTNRSQRTVKVDREALELLRNHDWKGNVRQLRNCVRKAYRSGREILTSADFNVEAVPLPTHTSGMGARPFEGTIPEGLSERQLLERAGMINALKECEGVITAAAEKFGVARQTFVDKMDVYWIPRKGRQGPRHKLSSSIPPQGGAGDTGEEPNLVKDP